MKEESPSEMKLFGENILHDFKTLKSNKNVQPSTPKKGTNTRTNLTTPSPVSK